MDSYLAVIGDLIGSRQLPDRAALQENLKHSLHSLNTAYDSLIVSKFTLTLGDEFQALIRPDHRVMQLADEIEMKIGTPIRIGLGYGTMLTSIDREYSVGADGEAYWNARHALTHLKETKAKEHIRVKGFGAWQDDCLNALLAASEVIKHRWTDLQHQTFHEMLRAGIYSDEFRQVDFAAALGIEPSSLTKRLNAGAIKTYIRTRLAAGRTLEVFHDQ